MKIGSPKPNLTMTQLSQTDPQSPTMGAAERWITSMTPLSDNEDGPDFWRWISEHQEENATENARLLDTYLFSIAESGELVATISLISDDRGVGLANKISGIWMGGANVKKGFRGQGIGGAAFIMLDAFIQSTLDADAVNDLDVNLFTTEKAIESIVGRLGYKQKRKLHVKYFHKQAVWWRKEFRKSKKSVVSPTIELSRSDVIRYLSDTNTRVLSYHNHKEVSAWSGVAFFYVFCSAILALVDKHIGTKSLLILWTIATAVASFFYVLVQLRLRRTMGHLTIALPRLCCKIFSMTTEEFSGLNWTLSDLRGTAHYNQSRPQFISDEFDQVARTKHWARLWLEIFPVALLLMATIAVIVIIWNSLLPESPPAVSKIPHLLEL